MKVLFASGDIGGARALLPVIERCAGRSLPFLVLDRGSISKEIPTTWEKVSLEETGGTRVAIGKLLQDHGISVLVFSSSVHDTTPLALARVAKEMMIPVIHVLDHWSGYAQRMRMDHLPLFVPDTYTVMDDLAYEAAVDDGIEESILATTGQPAFSSLHQEYILWEKRNVKDELRRLGLDPGKKTIVFVSEPVTKDQGASPSDPRFRGYTEKSVLPLLCEALQPVSTEIQMGILPHPREDAAGLRALWKASKGHLSGDLLSLDQGRKSLWMADGLCGMASVLLYEAWLLGKPVLSLQPDLRLEELRMFQKREGVFFVDSGKTLKKILPLYLSEVSKGALHGPRPELEMHREAPDKVCMLIEKYNEVKKREELERAKKRVCQ